MAVNSNSGAQPAMKASKSRKAQTMTANSNVSVQPAMKASKSRKAQTMAANSNVSVQPATKPRRIPYWLIMLVTALIGAVAIILVPIIERRLASQPPINTAPVSVSQLESELANANIILTEVTSNVGQARKWLIQLPDHQVLAQNCLKVLEGKRMKHPVPLDVIMGNYRQLTGYAADTPISADEYNNLEKLKDSIFMTWKERHPTSLEKSFNDILTTKP